MKTNIKQEIRKQLSCRMIKHLFSIEGLVDTQVMLKVCREFCKGSSQYKQWVIRSKKDIKALSEALPAYTPLSSINNDRMHWIKNHFRASKIELDLISIMALLRTDPELNIMLTGVFKSLKTKNLLSSNQYLALILNIDVNEVVKWLASDSQLLKSRMITQTDIGYLPVSIYSAFTAGLYEPDANRQQVYDEIVVPANITRFRINQFPMVSDDLPLAIKLLRNGSHQKHNILLHGNNGSGRTELAKRLTQSSGKKGYILNPELFKPEEFQLESKFEWVKRARYILNARKEILVVDSVDDIIDYDCTDNTTTYEATVSALKSGNASVIWIVKKARYIQELSKFFSYRLRMDNAPTRYKLQLLNKAFPQLSKSLRHEALPSLKNLNLRRLNTVISSLGEMKPEQLSFADIQGYLNNLTPGFSKNPQMNTKSNAGYSKSDYVSENDFDPSLSNTDLDLEGIELVLSNNHEGRFLLHGVPGTGKTAYVQYLGKKLDMPVLEYSGASILNKYVGESEKQISAMFQEATITNAILLLDEADSFLTDRNAQGGNWRTNIVNEFLMHMERFTGIFFACTNRPDSIDSAVKRRIDFDIRFDYMKPEQVARMFANITGIAIDQIPDKIKSLKQLTPSDFSGILRKNRILGIDFNAEEIESILINASEAKADSKRPIGFL